MKNLKIQLRLTVLGLIDDTHTAAAQFLDDAIVRNRLPNHSWRISPGLKRQINESRGVGNVSEGLVLK
jgi:hypothetical protein